MPTKLLSHSSSARWGENTMKKLMSFETRTGRYFTNYHHGQNRFDLGKINLFTMNNRVGPLHEIQSFMNSSNIGPCHQKNFKNCASTRPPMYCHIHQKTCFYSGFSLCFLPGVCSFLQATDQARVSSMDCSVFILTWYSKDCKE